VQVVHKLPHNSDHRHRQASSRISLLDLNQQQQPQHSSSISRISLLWSFLVRKALVRRHCEM
jgi:hypothetical protein